MDIYETSALLVIAFSLGAFAGYKSHPLEDDIEDMIHTAEEGTK